MKHLSALKIYYCIQTTPLLYNIPCMYNNMYNVYMYNMFNILNNNF